jgi:hypothetical protein
VGAPCGGCGQRGRRIACRSAAHSGPRAAGAAAGARGFPPAAPAASPASHSAVRTHTCCSAPQPALQLHCCRHRMMCCSGGDAGVPGPTAGAGSHLTGPAKVLPARRPGRVLVIIMYRRTMPGMAHTWDFAGKGSSMKREGQVQAHTPGRARSLRAALPGCSRGTRRPPFGRRAAPG